ncbi:N-acetyl-1-D-myo-inositol-2-amino-2-deoxy-alpha-D-glucopyranoside deacetylase [Naumannella cuiyingiana]|uniref:N-acetyl-1-D-myo-inositol-2-amino-2-deoxy-alpha-D-glucopyranoside deacetylase n=1 Tax=Naumannella cuiyingiana TaxID=1347891 RepID=A0A7Z0DAE5_9ACTN|nr:N-acetyl-1-D-myo-inositol-2-amino-2-deoxy-alpha-D-glucopyranoside deacetylase [Naumannella cuiyingiana]
MIPHDERRLMLVHAHPDDESSQTALTMAKYAAQGARVTLVTATLGELGEIVSDRLKHLTPEQLGRHRLGELDKAMAELGITDAVRLGGDFRYHDSGMAYAEDGSVVPGTEVPEGAFWHADLREAADLLVALIRDRRPQVMITYDDFGGYGHPDHIQAHRVTMYAYLLAAIDGYRPDLGEPWQVSRLFWSTWARGAVRELIRALREAGDTESFGGLDPDSDRLPMGVPDELISVGVHAPEHAAAKEAALRAHESQVNLDDGFFAAFAAAAQRAPQVAGTESYRLAAGIAMPPGPPADDLFAGLS